MSSSSSSLMASSIPPASAVALSNGAVPSSSSSSALSSSLSAAAAPSSTLSSSLALTSTTAATARRKKRVAVAPDAQKIRVYAHKKSEPSKNRVLAIDTSMSWDELLQLVSQKFQFQATYVALEVGSQNVEIDDVGALHVKIQQQQLTKIDQ